MRLAWLGLLLVPLACGGGQERAAPADEPVAEEPRETSPEGKQWGGWRWKGKRDDCFFVVGNKCFDKQVEACAAAGCDEDRCLLQGGGPAKVSCRKR